MALFCYEFSVIILYLSIYSSYIMCLFVCSIRTLILLFMLVVEKEEMKWQR